VLWHFEYVSLALLAAAQAGVAQDKGEAKGEAKVEPEPGALTDSITEGTVTIGGESIT
jgi:hypothetical protein